MLIQLTDARRTITALFLSFLLVLVACNQNTVAQEAQIIGNAGASLAAILGNTVLATKIKTDTSDLVAAIQNFKKGDSCQNIQQIATIVLADFNDIVATFNGKVPPNVQALIDLAVTTLLALLPLLPGCQTPASIRAMTPTHGTQPAKDAKDFKTRWNAIAVQSPQTAGAVIK